MESVRQARWCQGTCIFLQPVSDFQKGWQISAHIHLVEDNQRLVRSACVCVSQHHNIVKFHPFAFSQMWKMRAGIVTTPEELPFPDIFFPHHVHSSAMSGCWKRIPGDWLLRSVPCSAGEDGKVDVSGVFHPTLLWYIWYYIIWYYTDIFLPLRSLIIIIIYIYVYKYI